VRFAFSHKIRKMMKIHVDDEPWSMSLLDEGVGDVDAE
jgi:hypothetical protein